MADNKKEPTPAEAMLFYSIVKHTRNKADVDWDAVAVESGFKNADVAKVRFGQVKRKLGIANESGTTTPKKSPAASKVTKPRSTGKGRGGGRSKVKKEVKEEAKDEDEDEDELETPTKPRGIKTEQDEEGPGHQLKEEMNTTYQYEQDMTDPF